MVKDREQKQVICPYAHTQICSTDSDDEIDLLDVWKVLWERRLLILVVTVMAFAAVSVYALLLPKTYEAKVKVAPSADLGMPLLFAEIKTMDPTHQIDLTPKIFFESVIDNLQDRAIQAQFWDESDIVKRLNNGKEAYSSHMSKAWFMQSLSVKLPLGKTGDKDVVASLKGGNPDILVDLLNDYISYVDKYSGREIIDNLKLKLAEMKFSIAVQIEKLRDREMEKIKFQITQLEEQKTIAEKSKMIEMHIYLAQLEEQKITAEQSEVAQMQSRLRQLEEQKTIAEQSEMVQMQNYLKQLEEQKTIAEQSEMVQMQNRLRRLEEQKTIAEKLNIVDVGGELEGRPLYSRGVKALQSEIDIVKKNIVEVVGSSSKVQGIQFEIDVVKKNIAEGAGSSSKVQGIQFEIDVVKKNIAEGVGSSSKVQEIQAAIDVVRKKIVGDFILSNKVEQIKLEIDRLRHREDIDLFINGLAALQKQLVAIEGIGLSNVKIHAMKAEGAFSPILAKKSKQQIFIAVGTIFGLMVGVLAAFSMKFVANMRQSKIDTNVPPPQRVIL